MSEQLEDGLLGSVIDDAATVLEEAFASLA